MLYEQCTIVLNGYISCRLNPCFNGICSMRNKKEMKATTVYYVLILVLMEYAL